MKKMLITGTTQGIGYHIFKRFEKDYEIITINRRNFEHKNVVGKNYICDLSNITEVQSVAKQITEENIDILINNAGGGEPVCFSDMQADELIKCTNLNYHAPVLLMQAVVTGMKERKFGKIINISSIASKSPRPLIPHYGAAKSALEKFSSSMAVYYGESGININCICPGGVHTNTSIKNRRQMARLTGLEEDFYNKSMADKNGLGRMVFPDEVVNLIEFLLSDSASAISGQVINLCGTREVR